MVTLFKVGYTPQSMSQMAHRVPVALSQIPEKHDSQIVINLLKKAEILQVISDHNDKISLTKTRLLAVKTECCHSVIAVSGGHIGLLHIDLKDISRSRPLYSSATCHCSNCYKKSWHIFKLHKNIIMQDNLFTEIGMP